jgi:hypothetical protein
VDGKYFFLNAKPGAELSPRELSRVEELERNFSGLNYVMRSVKNLLDIDDAQARDLLFNTPGVRRQEQVPATNAQVRDVKLRFTDEQRAEWEKLPEDLRNKILEGVRQEVSTGQEFRVTTGQPAQPAGR